MNTAEDLDDLSRACFTIPCGPVPTQAASSSAASASLPAGAFPCLSAYETSPLPAQLRRQAHALAAAALDAALERTLDALYAPLVAGLKAWAAPAEASFWLPGAAPLPTAALLGAARHASLPARLSSALLGKSKISVFVELAASEYDSLHSAQSLLLRRARRDITMKRDESIAQGKRKEEGIDDLMRLGIETLFVSLPALPSHPPAALQDLLSSLASASRDSGTRVCLLFWLPSAPALAQRSSTRASGVGSLADALPLPAAVRKLCEIQSFTLPTASETWDTVTLQLHMNKHHVPPIWLGPALWEQIERGFHDVDGRVESVWRALHLAALDHFSAEPLSTLLCKSVPPSESFTPAFYARLRQLLLSAVESHGRVPPRPSSAVDLRPRAHFELLLSSDEHLLATMSEVAQAQRSATRTRNLGLQAIAALDSKLEIGQAARPKPGQLWSALLSGSIAGLIGTLCSSLHAAPLAVLLAALDELDGLIHREHGPAWLAQEAKEWQAKLGEQKDEAMDVDCEEGRVERVHRQLVREESLSDAKKELVSWLRRSLHTLCVAPHELAFAEIFVYDDASAVSSLLEPAPRAVLLAALNDPWAFLHAGLSAPEDGRDDEEEEEHDALRRAQAAADVPDVCRAYVLYRDAGRLLNLADWYNAFAQGIEAQARQRDGADAEVDEDETQARFARSVSELAALGFLRRTGRKPEHVSKTIFDLPPSKVKAKAGGGPAKTREASVRA